MACVSVIVPVYNTGKYLKMCLDSLINQTFDDIEIITINDGSTDNSLKILNEYVSKYPGKIKLINSTNQGAGKARNLGIDIASGDYIWFVDSDDWLEHNAVEKMYNAAIKYDVPLVTCDLQRRIGTIKRHKEVNGQSGIVDLNENPEKLRLATPGIGNKLIKKSLLGDIRMPGLKWEDLSFTYAIAANSGKFYNFADKIYNYRISFCSVSIRDQLISYSRIAEIFEVLSILEQHFKNLGLYEKHIEQLQKIYFSNSFQRVADVSTWVNFSRKRKEALISLLLNMIELKCRNINISEKINGKMPFRRSTNYLLKKYARPFLNEENLRLLNEEEIKDSIVKVFK